MRAEVLAAHAGRGEVLIDVLQALGGVQDQAERVAIANSILGIGAKELLPLIRDYSELEREVTKLGFGMDEHLLKRLGQGSDEIDTLKMRWDLLVRHLLANAGRPQVSYSTVVHQLFAEMQTISGDVGAKALIGEYPEAVCEVAMADDGVLCDVDTPEALAAVKSAG